MNLEHSFANPQLLATALTHRSHAHEHGGEDNERLEFLGDAVLQMSSTVLLMEEFPDAREGELSRLRSRLVSTAHLAVVAETIELSKAIKLGKGERKSGGATRPKLLAASVEAVLGAVYEDAGFHVARELVRTWCTDRVAELKANPGTWKDARSALQEAAQRVHGKTPAYEIIGSDGPAHEPVFHAIVRVAEKVLGTGTGQTKREAYRIAAFSALGSFDE